MKRLKNQVALITGASKGIGLAIAEIFAKNGAFCILSDIDPLGEEKARALGSSHSYIPLDVSKPEEWQKAMEHAEKMFGRLDILVNNAGITGFGVQDPEHLSLEDWRKVHSINLDGVFLGCKYAIQMMRKQKKGAIINISSRSGLVGIPGAAAYASSKAAVRNHTKSVALYAQQEGLDIRANSIHPAAILTPLWDAMLGSGKNRAAHIEEIAQNIPMKKMGSPDDVAYAAVYLASDEAKYITGTELTIDGGLLAGAGSSPKKMD